LQCELRLWRELRAAAVPERGDAVEAAELEAIACAARALFPRGVRLERPEAPDAPERTRALLADPALGALFDGVFAAGGARVRADVLERVAGGRWGLRVPAASARAPTPLLERLALTLHVLRASGLEVGSVELVHPDPVYVRPPGPLDPQALLGRAEIGREVAFLAQDVAADLERLARVAEAPRAPAVEPSPHCRKPHPCPYWADCTRALPSDWIGRLPALEPLRYHELRERGWLRAAQIPAGFALKAPQRNAARALASGGVFAAPALRRELQRLAPPLHFLDFEAVAPALPLFEGTRPFELLAFQWSLHTLDAGDRLAHRLHLAGATADPRPELAAALCAALVEEPGAIAVYSRFEAEVLESLAASQPAWSGELRALRERLFDLQALVRRSVYHPGFNGSFSLKRVAPALAAGFDYADLEVRDGVGAAQAWLRLAREAPGAAEASRLRGALAAYGERDTEALVVLYRALAALTDPPGTLTDPPGSR
jgi:hypothetical protein